MGTKNNPGPFDCYAKADPDEPIFVLRAKDPLAPALVRLWAHVRMVYDSAKGEHDASKYREANDCALDMEHWREKQVVKQLAIKAGIEECICGHLSTEHNIIQDFGNLTARGYTEAQKPRYIHCKQCKCPVFQRPNM